MTDRYDEIIKRLRTAMNREAPASAERERVLRAALADDIRAAGWMVAVHNDYRLHGKAHTFWLFTKDGSAVKGEGLTDAEALNEVRAAITALQSKEAGNG